jgi:hypothetical protein
MSRLALSVVANAGIVRAHDGRIAEEAEWSSKGDAP